MNGGKVLRAWRGSSDPIATAEVAGFGAVLIRPAYPPVPHICADDAMFFAGLRKTSAVFFFDPATPTAAQALNWAEARYADDFSQINLVVTDGVGQRLAYFGFTDLDFDAGTAEFGRVMKHSAAPRGLMAPVLRAAFDAVRAGLGLRQLILEVFAGNAAARGLYDRLGFQQTGTRWFRCSDAGVWAPLRSDARPTGADRQVEIMTLSLQPPEES